MNDSIDRKFSPKHALCNQNMFAAVLKLPIALPVDMPGAAYGL
jgi:hypothetical protein